MASGLFARFPKFAVVGGLGTLVNLAILYALREWILPASFGVLVLPMAQLIAIGVATVHNFALNRAWTWGDRHSGENPPAAADFLRYLAVASISICLQLLCVQLLSGFVHYLVAAAAGIVLASFVAFILNDKWSFAQPSLRMSKIGTVAAMCLAGLVAVSSYLFALDSQMMPKNGDENVYLHITRITGLQGNWLPLQSELDGMRNTKPPMLFWQGMLTTQLVDQRWDVAILRLPNVLFSLLSAGLIAALGWVISRKRTTAVLAALVWLGFLSTFRYGRPFLTTAPEVLLLFAPFAAILVMPKRWLGSIGFVPAGLGLLVGLGLLYKSFTLLAPVGLGLVLARAVMLGQLPLPRNTWRSCLPVAIDALKWGGPVALVALGVFGLWPLMDPDPAAIWREFVIGENLGKFTRSDASWLELFVWGGNSLWVYLAACLLNPGPLVVAICGALLISWRKSTWSPHEASLWLWVLVWVGVFSLPSQRSARYILPAMPAVALLAALSWTKISPWVLRMNHAFVAVLAVLIGLLAWGVRQAAEPDALADVVTWGLVLVLFSGSLLAAWLPRAWVLALPVSALVLYMALAAAFRPIDRLGFSAEARSAVSGAAVAVPCNFRAKFEEYRFALAGAEISGYSEGLGSSVLTTSSLSAQFPVFVQRLPFSSPPPQCLGCKVLGSRFVVRSRHSSYEIKRMLSGEVVEHLIARDWLVDGRSSFNALAVSSPNDAPGKRAPSPLGAALLLPVNRCL